ncbi:MAG TPA: LON peptidase substrate-binding domain-containing protein [Gemmatimonas sp.]|nr:LON peptidase substrate-binding domain-containing protein [Gemmatimonas sp.]
MPPLRLPLFPLGLVLFPGVSVPLHLFEPRYRQLLADIKDTTRRFGIIAAMPAVRERELPRGRVGCVAEVTDVEMMPDGRANIIIVGRERFTLDAFVDDPAEYNVADVLPFSDHDTAPPVALAVAADEVVLRFKRVVAAVRTLNREEPGVHPELPDDPGLISFAIAGMIDLDLTQRQNLLTDRSAESRLSLIDAVLRNTLPDLELRAAMHAGRP